METVRCNLCDSQDETRVMVGPDRLVKTGGSFRLVRCCQCHLVYVNPRPDPTELVSHYPAEYTSFVRDYPQLRPKGGVLKAGFDMVVRRRLPRASSAGRALEIGSGGASYLMMLRDLGWEVHGVEVSPDLAQHARDQFGLDVRTGRAETELAEYPNDYFDLVSMWHVLEHLSDPHGVLREVRRILKPGGQLMMELPNFAAPSRFVFRTYWSALDVPRHLYHFTPVTLKGMLTRAGLTQVTVRGVPAALAATMSLQLMWNQWKGRTDTGIVASLSLLLLIFPFSALLAWASLSSHMAADAVKPNS